MKRLALAILLFPGLLFADYELPVGERATYNIQWGLFNCGTSTISCEEAELDGRDIVRIRVRVQSNWLVSTVYPVDDTVDCYLDPETLESVRLEKNTSEGGFVCQDVLEIDRENNIASWTSHSDNISTNYPIPSGTCGSARAHGRRPRR